VLAACLLAAVARAAGPCPAGVREAAAAVGRLHGEPPLRVACERIGPGELRRRLARRLRRELPLPLPDYLEALSRLGLVDGASPEELRGSLLDLLAAQVLGYYDPPTDRMVLVERPGLEALAPLVWAHELEHADQQRRFGLPARVLALARNGDAQLAAAAVAEGDAVLAMAAVAVASERPTPAELAAAASGMLDQLGAVEAAAAVPGVPRFFVRQLLFPYVDGLRLVVDALRRGGWAAVEALERDPPRSTEQVLHPERRGDAPTPVPPGALPPLPAGFTVVYTDTVGEWGLREWLGLVLDADAAAAAAAGWDGDRLRLARRGDLWRLDLVTVWDSPEDAGEALQALLAVLPRRLRLGPGGGLVRVARDGTVVSVEAVGLPAG